MRRGARVVTRGSRVRGGALVEIADVGVDVGGVLLGGRVVVVAVVVVV